MDTAKSAEKPRDAEYRERVSGSLEKPEIRESSEVQRETSEIVDAGAEAAETAESREAAESAEISEVAGEDKKKGPRGAFPAVKTADEVEMIRARLLQNLPPKAVMVRQIKRTLQKQEKELTRQYYRIRRNGHKNAFELNIVIAKWRHIREFFAKLADATFEIIKQLWLKIVHGV